MRYDSFGNAATKKQDIGVAGAGLPGQTILFTGLAGMLARALSMTRGEWISMQSARELYTHQIAVEQQELAEIPEEEQEELALIYQAKGIDPQTAGKMARHIMRGEKAGMVVRLPRWKRRPARN